MVTVRPIEPADRPAVRRIQVEQWDAETSVGHGVVFHPAELDGFLAIDGSEIIGMLTYTPPVDGVMEIVTIDALRQREGIGTQLIDAAVSEAASLGAQRVVLTTTNDNVDALRFYQRRGFRLCALRAGQVSESRKLKPEIPPTGSYGIPLTDELELEREITPAANG
ncbi:MAG TPA: GNAT family N-acetyltransferase [Pseudonocardiaceae bacterium]|jgi:ribosomal protein S18 acetylase RimI-like enzyme|nr:GNAT family N-acetyltransferase [Pseudonocardiaceae bacterium]